MAFVIDDATSADVTHLKSRGLVPRNFATHPNGCYEGLKPVEAVQIPLIPRSEWSARIKERKALNAGFKPLRRTRAPGGGIIPSLDQDGIGYCWCHSATMGAILTRARMGQPYKRLSAFMVGCLMKNYRDQGGWGADAADFISKNGVPDEKFWPQQSMQRSNDTPDMRANAALHKIKDGWVDLSSPVYDRNLTFDQVMSILIAGDGVVIGDFNWWGHSVLLIDADEPEPGSFCPVGINSWTDDWGDKGEFTLAGNRAVPDGAVAILSVTPSLN